MNQRRKLNNSRQSQFLQQPMLRHGVRRSGFTLFELTIAISISTVMLTVNVIWIRQTMKYAKVQKIRQESHQTLTRLGRQFRDDVQTCRKALVDGPKLELRFDEGATAVYQINDQGVLVQRFSAQDKTAPQSVNSFKLAPNAIAKWHADELPNWVGLEVKRGNETLPVRKGNTKKAKSQARATPKFTPPALTPDSVDLYLRVSPNRWKKAVSEFKIAAKKPAKSSDPNKANKADEALSKSEPPASGKPDVEKPEVESKIEQPKIEKRQLEKPDVKDISGEKTEGKK